MQTVSQSSAACPRPVSLTAPDSKDLLDRFQRDLDASERIAPMHHSYKRIDPYIVKVDEPGCSYSFIVYHAESDAWYGQMRWKETDSTFVHPHEHGMVRPGDVIFDIGCNSGFTTCWYALSTGPSGSVHAFDPFPWNAIATRYNAELNGLRNVTVHQVGIGAAAERIRLSLYDARISTRYGPHVIDAQIYPLSHYQGLEPDILKIDIEGAEYELSQTDSPSSSGCDFARLRSTGCSWSPAASAERPALPTSCATAFSPGATSQIRVPHSHGRAE